jgi:hypothetical protein
LKKYNDVKKNPAKYYKEIPGYEAYRWSKWYWNPRKAYGKDDPPSRVTPTLFVLIIVFPFVLIASVFLSQNYDIPPNALGFGVNGSLWAALALFSSFAIGYTLPALYALHSTRANDIAYTLFQMGKQRRNVLWEVWLKRTIVSAVLFSISWAVYLCSYGYVSESEIVYKSIFKPNEQVFEFSSLKDIVIETDDKGEIKQYYLVNESGETFDVYWYGYSFLFQNEELDFKEYVLEKIHNASKTP